MHAHLHQGDGHRGGADGQQERGRGSVHQGTTIYHLPHHRFSLQEDEDSFKTFAVYCGLALHHAKLYDKIRRSEQKYKVGVRLS